jgi:ssDNA-binding Zn-finger/Zn-ribbon topoisomerase 1
VDKLGRGFLAAGGNTPEPPAIPENTCPYCGARLVPRTGPYGPFLGCRSYPHCQYTRNL